MYVSPFHKFISYATGKQSLQRMPGIACGVRWNLPKLSRPKPRFSKALAIGQGWGYISPDWPKAYALTKARPAALPLGRGMGSPSTLGMGSLITDCHQLLICICCKRCHSAKVYIQNNTERRNVTKEYKELPFGRSHWRGPSFSSVELWKHPIPLVHTAPSWQFWCV